MIKDIYTGTNGSSPQEFTGVGEAVFFYATDNSHGQELWVMGLEPEVIEEDSVYMPVILRSGS
jgi:hypothetical protein